MSIAGFLWLLIHNTHRRRALIKNAVHLPLPGCPAINGGIQWAQWIPGMCTYWSLLPANDLFPPSNGLRGGHVSLGRPQDPSIDNSEVEQ